MANIYVLAVLKQFLRKLKKQLNKKSLSVLF